MRKLKSILFLLIQFAFSYIFISPLDELFLNQYNINQHKPHQIISMHVEEEIKNDVDYLIKELKDTESKEDLTEIKNKIGEDIQKIFEGNNHYDNRDTYYKIVNSSTYSNREYNITALSAWDDIVAGGLWFALFVIFGPTAIVVLILYICCKNVVLRDNPSPLLG